MNNRIIIEGLGYRELDKLADMLKEIAEKGQYKGTPMNPTLEGFYDSKIDELVLEDEWHTIVNYIED